MYKDPTGHYAEAMGHILSTSPEASRQASEHIINFFTGALKYMCYAISASSMGHVSQERLDEVVPKPKFKNTAEKAGAIAAWGPGEVGMALWGAKRGFAGRPKGVSKFTRVRPRPKISKPALLRLQKAHRAKLVKNPVQRVTTAPANLQQQKLIVKSGRGKNHLSPNPNASGAHSSFRTDKNGRVSYYETYEYNKNAKKLLKTKRVDTQYSSPHSDYNKVTRQKVPTPHVKDNNYPGRMRPAEPDELPFGGNK